MSERPELEYRGYTIHYAVNEDVWRCAALDVSSERLPTVKAKIDKVVVASRRVDNVPAIYRVEYGISDPQEVIVVTLAQNTGRHKDKDEPTHAWCLFEDTERYFDGEKRAYARRPVQVRKKIELKYIFKDTPENKALMAEANRLAKEAEKLARQRSAVLKGLTPLVLTDLKTGDVAEED